MTLDELLEQFDEVLDSGIKIPGKKTVVDIEKLRAVVDDIRLNIPAKLSRQRALLPTAQILLQTPSARRTVLYAMPRSAQRL